MAELNEPVSRGNGVVGQATPKSGPMSGPIVVRVERVAGCNDGIEGAESDHMVCRCVYPDGFVKNHPATDLDTLVSGILSQVRNRHGIKRNLKVSSQPDGLVPGEIVIEVES